MGFFPIFDFLLYGSPDQSRNPSLLNQFIGKRKSDSFNLFPPEQTNFTLFSQVDFRVNGEQPFVEESSGIPYKTVDNSGKSHGILVED